MQFTDERILKARKTAVQNTVIGCTILFLMMAGLFYGLADAASKIKKADSFYNIMLSGENPNSKAAYIDTEYEILTFAYEKERYTGKYVYCFVMDENDYFYILKAREKTVDKLNEEIEANGSTRINGYTHEFRDREIRGYALETLQELYPEENLTAADIDDIFGGYELKITKMSPLSVLFENSILCGLLVIALIIGVLFAIAGAAELSNFITIEQQMPERIELLENEIRGEGTIWLDTLKMYLCENYFIALNNGIRYSKYTDLLMIYKTIHKSNFVKTGESISVLVTNGAIHQLANVSRKISFKASEVDNELSVFGMKAKEKNPDIFLGYDAQVLADLQRRAKNGEFKEKENRVL